ncbi:MAG: hypothetical protein ACSLEY_02585 [Candidatus Saccharimonadales bacterium]
MAHHAAKAGIGKCTISLFFRGHGDTDYSSRNLLKATCPETIPAVEIEVTFIDAWMDGWIGM